MNIPNSAPEIKDEAIKCFEKLPKVKTKVVSIPAVYKPNEKPVVITKARAVSQADIMQTYKFPIEDSAKDYVTRKILNSILSSSSIGLFDTLREKEHLAYSVYSDLDKYGDSGELSLNILTTTDNIDTGEVSYDNIKKSINGFNRQIQALRNSKFTDKDLENAKKYLQPDFILHNICLPEAFYMFILSIFNLHTSGLVARYLNFPVRVPIQLYLQAYSSS